MKLGRYEVVRELGKGAMGIVYLARDPVIGRMVALKTIRQTSSPDDEVKEFQQRFVREAQAAGVLSHPAIVTVHDIGEDTESGVSFIAMEYVEGPNLKEILNQGTSLTFEQVASMVGQVAQALDYAHSKGIVHRDVKPANIICLPEWKVKITDFGIAKIASSANLTTTGQFLGTPNYMAPEQIRGAPVDGRSDIFSLGIVLYECLTRKKPFGGDSLTTISYRIVHEPFPKLKAVNPLIPVEFEEVVQKCLEKDPKNRYQRGLEVSRALEGVGRIKGLDTEVPQILADETILTREDSNRGRISTLELPFPEAATLTSGGGGEIASPGKAARREGVAADTPPIWQRSIAKPVFFAVPLMLLAAMAAGSLIYLFRRPEVPSLDRKQIELVERQRKLRLEGNALISQGNVDGAYQKFQELAQIAPGSAAVRSTLTKLESTRGEQTSKRQRVAAAIAKIDEGKTLLEKKDYARAVTAFGEAFQLDPSSDEATALLKSAQLEQQKAEQAQQQKLVLGGRSLKAALTPRPATITPAVKPGSPTPATTAILETRFDPPIAEGYIMVKVDGQTILHQNLWEEKGRMITRRRVTRNIRARTEVRPRSSEIQVWLIIPGKFNESKVIRVTFRPGTTHLLSVKYDARKKAFEASVS